MQISLKLIGLGIEPDPDRMCDPKLVSQVAPPHFLSNPASAELGRKVNVLFTRHKRHGGVSGFYNLFLRAALRSQVAEATQRVQSRYEDAMDRAILLGVAARTRLVPQASTAPSLLPH